MSKRNFFSVYLKSPQCFNKKNTWEKLKNLSLIWNCEPRGPGAPPHGGQYTKNKSGYPLTELQPQKGSDKQFNFFKFLILSRGIPWRCSPAKIAARWRYRPPSKNLTAHYNSQFCVSSHFCVCIKLWESAYNGVWGEYIFQHITLSWLITKYFL